jgi:hypothetical protein
MKGEASVGDFVKPLDLWAAIIVQLEQGALYGSAKIFFQQHRPIGDVSE